jgi:hypothetical protein
MNPKITHFLAQHHLLSLATYGKTLHCCSLFYAYDPHTISFIVASDPKTDHGQQLITHPHVAGTVSVETSTVGKIQGIQFQGEMIQDERGKEYYFKAFPYARVMNPTLWTIRLNTIKMTDNTLGFGKKLYWEREKK